MDTLQSLWKDFSERFRSPFVVSFILSWLIWNWVLVYSVFNFDGDYNLNERIVYITEYLTSHHLWGTLILGPLLTSFGASFIFYLAKAAFLGLDSLYENRLRIWVIKQIGIPDMVPRTDLEKRAAEIDGYKRIISAKDDLYSTINTQLNETEKNLNATVTQFTNYRTENPQIEIYQSLNTFFSGEWVCEFNIVTGGQIHQGSEIFTIDNFYYDIDKKGVFTIEAIRFDRRINVLTFKKLKSRTSEVNIVRLFKINDNLWSGIEEVHGGLLSYIRIYSSQNKPDHILVALNEKMAFKLISSYGIDNSDYGAIIKNAFG